MTVYQNKQSHVIEVIEVTPISVMDEKIFGKQRNVICKMSGRTKVLIIDDKNEIIFEPLI